MKKHYSHITNRNSNSYGTQTQRAKQDKTSVPITVLKNH